jgi:uncharacterized membrane protein
MAPPNPNQPNLPPAGRMIRTEVREAVSFSGPLPPPEVLRAYEEMLPGCATRIIEMAERQSAHRRELEQQMTGAAIQEMRSRFGEARFGQICALLLALLFVGAGTFAILQGHEVSGASIAVTGGGIGIPAIIAAFMRGKAEKPPEPPPAAGRQNPAPAKKSNK